MKQEDKELLLKDLCPRLPHRIKIQYADKIYDVVGCHFDKLIMLLPFMSNLEGSPIETCKPYLRPISSMTEEEAMEIAVLHDIKDILSVKITSDYIDVMVDDGFCGTERITIWYDEIVSSIECFDWLNAHHFDYRGLIEKGLALEAPEGMYNI